MNLDALRSLQEQASPGPWYGDERHLIASPKWGRGGVAIRPVDGILRSSGGETIGQMGYNDKTTPEERVADAKLAAISMNHLLPLAEALEAWIDKMEVIHNDPEYQGVWTSAHVHDLEYDGPTYEAELAEARKALKALQEALDG